MSKVSKDKKAQRQGPAPIAATSLKQKLKNAAVKAWDWTKDGGWQQILAVGLSLLASPEMKHLKEAVGDGTTIPAGTVIYSTKISPELGASRSNLKQKAQLYTYYQFVNSFVCIDGLTSSEQASGAIAVFINPDPSQDLAVSDRTAVDQAVLDFGGVICRLDQKAKVKVPQPAEPLYTHQAADGSVRFAEQGQLFVVAYTDIDLALVEVNVSLHYEVDFAKSYSSTFSSPVYESRAVVVYSTPVLTTSLFSSYTQSPMLIDSLLGGNWGAEVSGGKLVLPPGAYEFTGRMIVNTTGAGSWTENPTWVFLRVVSSANNMTVRSTPARAFVAPYGGAALQFVNTWVGTQEVSGFFVAMDTCEVLVEVGCAQYTDDLSYFAPGFMVSVRDLVFRPTILYAEDSLRPSASNVSRIKMGSTPPEIKMEVSTSQPKPTESRRGSALP